MKNLAPSIPSQTCLLSRNVLKKVVANQLCHHVEDNSLNEVYQSTCKQYHSTETALIKVQDDIIRAIDNNSCVILLLLDLSAAFDTVDHQTLYIAFHIVLASLTVHSSGSDRIYLIVTRL